MGVQGFLRFLEENHEFTLKPIKLKNSYMVIDGNNFPRVLYRALALELKFGGEYDAFYENVKKIFQNFIQCNITPIVVFDGVISEEKKEKSLDRWFAQIDGLKRLKKGEIVDILPKLLFPVFKYVLQELRIISLQSLFEGDKEAATIAKLLNCPLLSNDSDFCFFNIQFIPTRFMDFQMREEQPGVPSGEHYFSCSVFHRTAFMERFNLKDDMLLMIPILLGSEMLQGDTFKSFLKELMKNMTRDSCEENISKGLHGNYNQYKIKQVLKWVKEAGSFDSAVNVLHSTQNCDTKKVNEIINGVVKNFTLGNEMLSPQYNISKNILEINTNIQRCMIPSTHPLSKFSNSVIRAYFSLTVSPVFIKPYTNVIFSHIQYEDLDEHSSNNIGLPIFCGLFQIFNKILNESPKRVMLLRFRGTAVKQVKMYFAENFLPDITGDIFEAETEKRKRLMLQIMSFGEKEESVLNEMDSDWTIFIAAVVYWLKNRQLHMKRHTFHLVKMESLILTALLMYAKNRLNGQKFYADGSVSPLSRHLADIPRGELSLFEENMNEFRLKKPEVEYCLSTIHGFALFQECLDELVRANVLLSFPFPRLNVANFFSGTMAFNLNHYMNSPGFPEIAMKQTPSVWNVYNYLIEKVHEAVNHETIDK